MSHQRVKSWVVILLPLSLSVSAKADTSLYGPGPVPPAPAPVLMPLPMPLPLPPVSPLPAPLPMPKVPGTDDGMQVLLPPPVLNGPVIPGNGKGADNTPGSPGYVPPSVVKGGDAGLDEGIICWGGFTCRVPDGNSPTPLVSVRMETANGTGFIGDTPISRPIVPYLVTRYRSGNDFTLQEGNPRIVRVANRCEYHLGPIHIIRQPSSIALTINGVLADEVCEITWQAAP